MCFVFRINHEYPLGRRIIFAPISTCFAFIWKLYLIDKCGIRIPFNIMYFCRLISFLVLPIVIHSFRIQNYHIANSESKRKHFHSILENVEFRARLKSTEDFETTTNPIPVLIGFSSEVMTFDETHLLVNLHYSMHER